MIRFDGRVAVVTGSGQGLGAAYATLLAERGAQVVVHDAGVGNDGTGGDTKFADGTAGAIVSKGGTAIACYENLEDQEGCLRIVGAAVENFGRIDILIHNAGFLSYTDIEAISPDLFERSLRVHVVAPFRLTQAAWPHMRRQRYGRIVFTTSGRALMPGSAQSGLTAYAVGKTAPLGLMNTLAVEGDAHGIRVNAVSPVAATRMLQREVSADAFQPDQVAPGVVFLASEVCDRSGIVLHARDGHFAVGGWRVGEGVSFGSAATTPEQVADAWDAIERI